MELLRRFSTKSSTLDEEAIKQLSRQRRDSSFATVAIEEDPVLPATIDPPIQLFPGSISKRQSTLLISPDATANGFVVSYARTGKNLLTAARTGVHTKHIYGVLDCSQTMNPKVKEQEDESTKICTLTRDPLSIRKRSHVDDPYSHRRLMELEFSSSTWNAHELKAHVVLCGKYSDNSPQEPLRLRWSGRQSSLEGVLECRGHPVAVCATGEETEDGEFVVYVAPGFDLYIASMVVLAVEDRISGRRRSGQNSHQNSLGGKRDSNTIQQSNSSDSETQNTAQDSQLQQELFREINY